jgi:hypothetical protein
VRWYIKWWLELPEGEQLNMIAELVSRILITDAHPGRPSHAHFLSTMVAQFIGSGRITTGADVPRIPLQVLAPRVQGLLQSAAATSVTKRGWMDKVKRGMSKWH